MANVPSRAEVLVIAITFSNMLSMSTALHSLPPASRAMLPPLIIVAYNTLRVTVLIESVYIAPCYVTRSHWLAVNNNVAILPVHRAKKERSGQSYLG